MKKSMFASIALAVIVVGSAWAHHSMSVLFDLNQRFTESGTFTELDWRNPHSYFSVAVMRQGGQVETWRFEGPSPIDFRDGDIVRSDFENSIGKTVTVQASPARDGSRSGLIREITLADGRVVPLCPQAC